MIRCAVLLALFLSAVVHGLHAQQQPQPPEDAWNELYRKARPGDQLSHSEFLADMVKGRKPGEALDIGIGQGRNALLLATQGWRVTGFDISAEAITMVGALAQRTGLTINASVADVDRFDYGRSRWDLVCGMYMHDLITRNADKIVESMAPGALLVVEGFQGETDLPSVEARRVEGYGRSELPRAFGALRILRNEEAMAKPYWLKEGPEQRIIRFAAVKDAAK